MNLRNRLHLSGCRPILPLKLKQLNFVLLTSLLLTFQQLACGGSLPSQNSKYFKGNKDNILHAVFPSDFKWGVGSSAFQIEGGFQDDGKGESIWDKFTQNSDKIADKSNASISSDSYHKYKEDVQLIKSLGVKVYRFSISWSRVLPRGTTEIINKAGLSYYNNLIDELLAQGIEPIVCLFHWDLPQNLQDVGGWLNHETIGIFGDYSRLMYQTFGDRVKNWITINEIFTFCYYGYDSGVFAPGDTSDPSTHLYSCVHSLIMAHALAYRIYKAEFGSVQGGNVGISLDNFWQEPADPNSDQDRLAAQQSYSFRFDWIAYPLFRGEYPPIMRQIIDAKSKREGLTTSRLPVFDKEWTSKVNGSLDFLGVNHFTTQLVEFSSPNSTNASNWDADSGTVRFYDPSWPSTGSYWLKVVPEGIRKSLNKIKQDYGNPEVIITENGVSTESFEGLARSSDFDDDQRIEYHRLYLNQVLKAINLDGCNVTGYVVWSLLDGFEWSAGYTEKFGIFHVDHRNPNRTRTPKKSVKALQKIFKDNGFPSISTSNVAFNKNKTKTKMSISVISVPASDNTNTDKLPGSTLIVYSAPFAVALSAYYAYSHVVRIGLRF